MNTFLNVILIIVVVAAIVLGIMYYFGRKMERKQVESQAMIDAAKQTVTLIAIDKKKMKLKDAGLPEVAMEQAAWYAKRVKVPVVKVKVGPKILTMIAEEKAYQQLPLKTEAKVVISGLYITEVKSARGGLLPLPKKKTIGDRIKGIFKKDK
ncbi:MAG: hypothetical protein IJ374_06955 [Lachnospiraceae bacterium]|nr:hypothetical protein [Lachnospiraceae bacterium]